MLRFVYDNSLFGPLNFEFTNPRVRVGSCRDNDLVIPHPSVRPYHCTLALDEDSVAVLPPHAGEDTPLDSAPRYSPGDQIALGEIVLRVERSANSVGLPVVETLSTPDGRSPEGFWRADFPEVPATAGWLCSQCLLRFEHSEVRVIGLVGRRNHAHCPVCGRTVAWMKPRVPAPRGVKARMTALARTVSKWLKS